MKHILVWGFCILLSAAAHADEQPGRDNKAAVSIKVFQVADLKADAITIQVLNSSKDTLLVDRQSLQEPDYMLSKTISPDGREQLHTGSMHGSVGGKWTVAQLQRRESERVITIPAGQTFTVQVAISALLKGVDSKFQHGDIEAEFSFRNLILAVGNTEGDSLLSGAAIQADTITVHRP